MAQDSRTPRPGSTWRRGATAVAAAALLLAACGGGAQQDAASGDGGEEGENLVVLADDVAAGLNPDGPAASSTAAEAGMNNLYDTLLYYETNEQDGVLVPDYSSFEGRLAESWETSEDGRTWTFTLRDDVVSCAGNPLTADDVVYTFQRAKSVSGAAPIAWFLSNVGGVLGLEPLAEDATDADRELAGEVRKVDERTVEFNLGENASQFPMVLTIFGLVIFDAKEMAEHATEEDPWAHEFTNTEGAAGFGPYCLDSWTPGESMTLVSNADYYRGAPEFSRVTVRKVPENANRIAAVRTGEADVVLGLTPREYAELEGVEGVDVLGWQSNESIVLTPNYMAEPWSLPENVLLRQALAYAIPYDRIIDGVFEGKARQYQGLVPPGYTAQRDFELYEQDLDRAAELLAEAGFPEGEGLEQYAEGLELSYAVERKALLEPIALQIQTALAEVGIPITLNPITQSELATRELTQRDLPFGLFDHEHPIGPDAAYTAQLYFVSVDKGGVNNNTNYSSPEVDELWASSLTQPVGGEREETLGALQEQLMTDLPWVPVVLRDSEIAVRSGITGWLGRPDTTVTFSDFTSSE
jgi:peptide/nickel transport system substrate-binding protein